MDKKAIYLLRLAHRQTEKVQIKGVNKRGQKYYDHIDLHKALRFVLEDAAIVTYHGTLIMLYNRYTVREFVHERDNHKCVYCGKPGNTVDHIVPRSKGGISSPKNLVCACFFCNQLKSSREMDEFKKLLAIKKQFPKWNLNQVQAHYNRKVETRYA